MKATIILTGILILLFFFIRHLEQRTLFFPFREIENKPEEIGLHYEDISVVTEDNIHIAGWFIPSKEPGATLMFCHGNAGNISHRLEKIKMFHDLNLNVLIFDYRGYGGSSGKPSENGLYVDAEAVYDYLTAERQVSPGDIIVYGESLGGAVAIDLTLKRKVGGIIIESSFTSVKDMAKRILPIIPAFVYASKFDSLQKIKNVKSPKLIFHSANDEIVPFEFGRKLFLAATEPKEFIELRGGHNDAFLASKEIFIRGIDLFIKKLDTRNKMD